MSPKQYRRALESLGVNQDEAARALRIGIRTSHRWAAGDGRVPGWVPVVLAYWLRTGIRPDEVAPAKRAA